LKLSRRNLVLLGLVAVLVVLDLVLRVGSSGPRPGEPLFPGFDPASAAVLRIEQAGDSVVLTRDERGWAVAERDGFPAHAPTVEELLERLAALSSTDLVASERGSHELFGLARGAARLVVGDASDATLIDLWSGRPADEATGSYLRVEGSDAAYRAAAIPVLVAEPVRWLDTRVAEIDPPTVRVVDVTWAGGESQRLVRGEDGRWTVTGGSGPARKLTPQEVDPLLLVAGTVYLDDVSELTLAEAGLEPPALELSFELARGTRRRIQLGGEIESRFALTSPDWSRPWVALIGSKTARTLLGAAERLR